MKKVKRIMALILTVTVLFITSSSALAATSENVNENSNGARMYSTLIALSGDVIDGMVYTECDVDAPLSTVSIDLYCILRQENAAGNLVIVDTWTDSATGDTLYNEHEYSPAIEGREYELTVRVGIYDEDGLVGYDYETLSGIN